MKKHQVLVVGTGIVYDGDWKPDALKAYLYHLRVCKSGLRTEDHARVTWMINGIIERDFVFEALPQPEPVHPWVRDMPEQELEEFLVVVQEGEDEESRWYFSCWAVDVEHAKEQALDHSTDISVKGVFSRLE